LRVADYCPCGGKREQDYNEEAQPEPFLLVHLFFYVISADRRIGRATVNIVDECRVDYLLYIDLGSGTIEARDGAVTWRTEHADMKRRSMNDFISQTVSYTGASVRESASSQTWHRREKQETG
jgi:hypothetical protein